MMKDASRFAVQCGGEVSCEETLATKKQTDTSRETKFNGDKGS